MPAANVADALGWIGRHADRSEPPFVLVLGSLYLAGEVLRENQQFPD
jgi:dihydrofolate synthase/folylpolyglutamate synthase